MDSLIHQDTASVQCAGAAPRCGSVIFRRAVPADGTAGKNRCAETTGVQHVSDPFHGVAEPERIYCGEPHFIFIAGTDHFFCFFDADVQGFFAEDMFAGTCRGNCRLRMKSARRGDCDRLDGRLQQFLECTGEAALKTSGERFRLLQITVINHEQHGIAEPL